MNEEKEMNTIVKMLVVLAALFINNVVAQQDISGTWQGKLPLEGDAMLTVQFILQKAADGSWTAVVNSPDTGGIKNVKASAVVFDGGKLKIDVAELNGGYQGEFKDGAFQGEWTQTGTSMPLTLNPYEKPLLSQADQDLLQGEWAGKLEIPAGALTLVFRFTANDAGELAGFLRSPDQGGNEVPMADIELVDGTLSLKVPAAQVDVKGKLTGTQFVGEFKQGGGTMPLSMSKGKYEPPKSVLNLSREIMEQLLGEWHGELDTPVGAMTLVYRFEITAAGENAAFRESPDQGGNAVPVTDATLTDGILTLKTPGPGGEFNGKLAGTTITGEVKGPMGSVPLTLMKGKFVPPSYKLSLAQDVMDQLQGKWQGKLNTPQRELTLVFRFEAEGEGEYYGFVDSPDQGNTSLKIVEAAFANGELSLKTKFPRGEFLGKLAGNELTGQWKQGPANMPLSMKKD
jgi:hypothetical protein